MFFNIFLSFDCSFKGYRLSYNVVNLEGTKKVSFKA